MTNRVHTSLFGLYVLDSDHVTLQQQGKPAVISRLATIPPEQVHITVITVEEQLRGWLSVIRRTQLPQQLSPAYASL